MAVQPPAKALVDTEWKILIIDDDDDDFLIVREMLKEAKGRKFDVHWANTYEVGRKELFSNHYHAVLVDYDLGMHSGIEIIREANERGYASPLILFTGRGSYDVDVEAMQAGATLYLIKGEVNSLLLERAIRYAIEIKQRENDLREARETAERELAERKRAEEALRKSEAILRDSEATLRRIDARWNAAIESFKEGTIIATEDEQVIYWNPAAREMHGFTTPDEGIEPLEKTPITFQLWTPDGTHMLALDEWPMRRIKRGETVRNLELRIRRPDQGWEKVFSYSGVMVDTAGGERLIFLTCHDLTEKHRIEDALRESEQRLRLALTAAQMVAWEYDPATLKVTFSENAEEVLELPRRHENSDEGYKLLHPDDVERHRALVTSAIATGGSYVSVYRHPHKAHVIWLEEHGKALVDPSGKTIRLVGVVQNITTRKAGEEALQRALAEAEGERQTLNALMEYIPEGLTIAEGQDVVIRMVSRYGQEILGGSHEQKTAEQVANEWKVYDQDGITPLRTEQLPLVRAIQGGEVVKNQDLVQVNARGQRLYLSCSAGPIRDASGKITGGVVAWREISERKQMEDQLHQSNRALRQMQEQSRQHKDLLERLIQAAPAGIAFMKGPQHVYSLVNAAYERLARGKGQIVGRPLPDVWPEIADWVRPQLDQVYQTGEPYSMVDAPLTIIRNGVSEEDYFTYTFTPIFRSDGTIEGVMALAIETTIAVRDRLAVEAQSARLETVLQALPVGVWITDTDGRIIGKNQQSDRIWAGDAPMSENWEKYAVYEMLDPATQTPRLLDEYPLVQVLRTGQPVTPQENLIRRFDGSYRFALVSAAPIKDRQGQLTGAVATMLDISPQKQAEESLRQSQELLRAIIDNANAAIYAKDLEGRFILSNRYHAALLGQTPETMLGKTDADFAPAAPRADVYQNHDQTVATEGQPVEFEEVAPGMDGKPHLYLSVKFPLRDRNGEIYGICGISSDIDDRKQAEKELQRYSQELERSNQALQDFAIVASHDLQEPLRKIIMFGNSLRRHLCDTSDEVADENLDRMLNAAERMQTMITGLLDLSRIHARGRVFKPVNLTQVVEEVVSDLELRIQAAKGQVTSGELPTIEADELQMRQLFQNLIGNAIKFHKPDVSPVVHVSAKVDTTRQPQMVEIRIEDNGIGFEQKEADRVFQPFQRLHGRSEYEGTGLGLTICQKIVERHHGTIEVESIPGKGSTFIIRLPSM